MSQKITLYYLGKDDKGRLVFTSKIGSYAKTANVFDLPCYFLNADSEIQDKIIADLHTCEPWNDPYGEPDRPVDQGRIEVSRDCMASLWIDRYRTKDQEKLCKDEDSAPCP